MIVEEEEVAEADIIVLPPSKVDEQSDCEAIDENDLYPYGNMGVKGLTLQSSSHYVVRTPCVVYVSLLLLTHLQLTLR